MSFLFKKGGSSFEKGIIIKLVLGELAKDSCSSPCICCHHSWSIRCVGWALSLLGESGLVIQLGILLRDLSPCLLQFWELGEGNQKLPMAADRSPPVSKWTEASWGSGHWSQWGWEPKAGGCPWTPMDLLGQRWRQGACIRGVQILGLDSFVGYKNILMG